MDAARFIWLHGFGSGPQSAKAAYVAARLAERGVALEIPDLNEPSFHGLTLLRMLGRIDDLASASTGRLAIIGSSLGGYTAALYAEQRPERVAALGLLAPAFDLASRWALKMGEPALRRWREEGSFAFDHHALKRKEPLSVAFLEDAARHAAFPLPRARTLVVQGQRDDTVPPDLARTFAERMRGAGRELRLVEVDEGHELTADLPRLWGELAAHFAPELEDR